MAANVLLTFCDVRRKTFARDGLSVLRSPASDGVSEAPFDRIYGIDDGEDDCRGTDDGAVDVSLTSVPLGLGFLSCDLRGDVDLAAVVDFDDEGPFV